MVKVDWQIYTSRKMILSVLVYLLTCVSWQVHSGHSPCPSTCHCHQVIHMPDHSPQTRIRCSGSTIPDLSSLTHGEELRELTLDAYKNGNSINIKRQDFKSGLRIRSLVVKAGDRTVLHDGAFLNLNDFLQSLRVGNGIVFNSTLTFLRELSNLRRLELKNNKQYWTRGNDSEVVSLFSNLGLKGLKHLDMSYCFIYRMSEEVFLGVEDITSLDLSGNRLSEIPGAIGRLNRLQVLDISFNNIQSLQGGSFSKLYNLKTLRLAGNEFGELKSDSFIGLENNLMSLDLQMTKQKVIPTLALSKLTALKNLNISENPFKLMPADSLKGKYCLHRLDMHYTEVVFHQKMFEGQTDCIRVLSLYRPKLEYIPRKAIATLNQLQVLEFQGADVKVLKRESLSGIKASVLDLSFLPVTHIEAGTFNDLSAPLSVILVGTSLTSLDFALGYPSGTFQKLEVEGSLLCNCDLAPPLKELGCLLSATCARTDNSSVLYLHSNELRNYLKGCSVGLPPLVCSSTAPFSGVLCCTLSFVIVLFWS